MRRAPLRRVDRPPGEVPILAVSALVAVTVVAGDVRLSPAMAWLLASLNLAVIVVALVTLVSISRRARVGASVPSPAPVEPLANPRSDEHENDPVSEIVG